MPRSYSIEIEHPHKWGVVALAQSEAAALRWMREAKAANPGSRVRVVSPAGEVLAIDTAGVRQ